MKYIVIVGGMAGAGKTSYASALARYTNWSVLNVEIILEPIRAFLDETLDRRDLGFTLTRELMRATIRHAANAVQYGGSVILDGSLPGVSPVELAALMEEFEVDLLRADAVVTTVHVSATPEARELYMSFKPGDGDFDVIESRDAFPATMDGAQHIVDNSADLDMLRLHAEGTARYLHSLG